MGEHKPTESRNSIKWFYIFRSFTLNHFHTAIYVVYLRYLGFSFVTIASLHLAKDISSAVLEIPFSYLSDRIGHKRIMFLPGIFVIIMVAIIVMSPTTIMLHVAFVLWGAAVAAESGVSDAYLYSAVGEDRFPVIQSNSYVARQVLSAIFKLIGSITYAMSHLLPFLFSSANALISSISSLFLKNENAKSNKNKEALSLTAMKQTIQSKEFLTVLAHNTILIGLLGISFTYESVLLVDRGLKVELLGGFVLIKALVNSLGAGFSKRISAIKRINLLYFGLYLTTAFGIIALAIAQTYSLSLLALAVISFVNGIMMPYKTILINKVILGDRATLLSVQAQVSLILRSLGALAIGWLADKYSIKHALMILALMLLVSIILLRLFSKGRIDGLANSPESATS
ncbi:MAG: MFS transporter [Bacteroidales bacterium]|nr:MFS transporter [Bacteroidales bacterium]